MHADVGRVGCLAVVLLSLLTGTARAQDAYTVYCQDGNSRIVSTGVFTASDGSKGLRLCCGTKKTLRGKTWNDNLVVEVSGTPKTLTCSQPNTDSCCYDITAATQVPVPSLLDGVADADELTPGKPQQPAYVRDGGAQGPWLFWSSESMPYERRTWEENMRACHAGGGILLDLPMLSTTPDVMPGTDSTAWAAGQATITKLLNALPTYIDDATALHAALRTGFPSPACQEIDITAVISDHYKLSLPSSYPKFPNTRPYWEASGLYADNAGATGPGTEATQCEPTADDGCCYYMYTDSTGALLGTYKPCAGNNDRPSLCFKQRDFGRVSLDAEFVASYSSWQDMNATCAASAPNARLLIADSFYKRQYGLSALLWNDPLLLSGPLLQDPDFPLQMVAAIGMTQDFSAKTTDEKWSWSNGEALPSQFPFWYINANYFSEPNDWRADRTNALNTALGVTDKVEDGAENYAVLGIAGGSISNFDVCPKKPPMAGLVASFPADSYLSSGDAVAQTLKAIPRVELGSFLDVDLTSSGRKGLCEIPAPERTFQSFEMVNCVAYTNSVISGVAYSSNSSDGVPAFEARCSLVGDSLKVQAWVNSVTPRTAIPAAQVGACGDGVLKYALKMDASGLAGLNVLCPDTNAAYGSGASSTPIIASKTDDSNSSAVPIALGASAAVLICCALAAAIFLVKRRRKQKSMAEEGSHVKPLDVIYPPPPHGSVPYNTTGYIHSRHPSVGDPHSMPYGSYGDSAYGGEYITPDGVVIVTNAQGRTRTNDTLSDLTYTSKDNSLTGTVANLQSVQEATSLKDGLQFITHQIQLLLHMGNGVVFDRYQLHGMNETRYGGQGLVHFASARSTQKQFAIKFFVVREAFQAEMDLYAVPGLQAVLPPLDDVSSNDDGKWKDPLGRPLPPYMIMEKGEPLDEWVHRAAPDSLSTLALIGHLMEAVVKVHTAGLVHRDLKPSNTIFLSSTKRWTLIDFGSAAPSGKLAPTSISAHYAAPEVALAFEAQQEQTVVSEAIDVWALGIMAFELFTKTKVFPPGTSREAVFDAVTGRAMLPWEDEAAPQFPTYMRQLGRMRKGVLSMLRRNPDERAKLDEVQAEWNAIFHGNTHHL